MNVFVGESGDRLTIIQLPSPTEARSVVPDVTITYALIQMVGKIVERSSPKLVLRS